MDEEIVAELKKYAYYAIAFLEKGFELSEVLDGLAEKMVGEKYTPVEKNEPKIVSVFTPADEGKTGGSGEVAKVEGGGDSNICSTVSKLVGQVKTVTCTESIHGNYDKSLKKMGPYFQVKILEDLGAKVKVQAESHGKWIFFINKEDLGDVGAL